MTWRPVLAAIVLAACGLGSASAADRAPMTTGVVRKIDTANHKITIKHGEIENLGMAAMTMVFVAPPSILIDTLKTGDKVRFNADIRDGALTVTHIEADR